MKKINFQITGKCNSKCAFCSDAVSYQKDSSLEEIKEVIDRLKSVGLNEIHITGGEPLVYPKIKKVLEYIKEKKMMISLSTNGILLSQRKEVIPFLDEIILPIDASTSEVLEQMGRESNQIFSTIKNIVMIKEKNAATKITISTVLNRQNLKELKWIGEIINMLPVEEWQIHQFLPHGRGKRNIQKFILDDCVFEDMMTYLKTTSLAEKITPIPVFQKIDSEWSITPNLKLIKLKDEQPVFYGKVSELSDASLKMLFQDKTKVMKK